MFPLKETIYNTPYRENFTSSTRTPTPSPQRQCSPISPCPVGQFCVPKTFGTSLTVCKNDCRSVGKCPQNTRCNSMTMECEPVISCSTWSDCPEGSMCSGSGQSKTCARPLWVPGVPCLSTEECRHYAPNSNLECKQGQCIPPNTR
jgi:hypothetical protein